MAYEIPGETLGCYPADVDMTLGQFLPVFLSQAANTTGYGQGGAACIPNTPVAFTGNTTSGSPSVTSASPTTGLTVGQTVTGAGIPANTTITAISGSTLTLSANATATATAVALSAQLAGSAGSIPIGVVQNSPKVGEAASVMRTGVSKVRCVGTLSIGDLVYAASGGVAKATTGSGKYAFGRALEAAVTGDITTIELDKFGVQ